MSPHLCGEKRRRGFTLVDLLVAMTIVSVLAAITFGALGAARQAGRADSTRQTIAKLHAILMAKYDSYRTRRIPMDLRQYVWTHSPLNSECPPGKQYYDPNQRGWPLELARAKVNAVRDLMRLEMPDRFTDIRHEPLVLRVPNAAFTVDPPLWPALSYRYNRIYDAALRAADNDGAKLSDHAAAECLYMIVMAIPDAAEQFHDSEIGDVDRDGLPEFIDAWGQPIRFIRWPAGFYADTTVPSDPFYGDSDLQFGPQFLQGGAVNPKYQPDPFDPQSAVLRVETDADSFAMFPLIYSAGPDKEYDINRGVDGNDETYACSLSDDGNLLTNPKPQQSSNVAKSLNDRIGRPMNNDDADRLFEDLRHYDNIHNQRIE